MTVAKTQEKRKSFIKPEWIKETKAFATEGGKVVLQGMLFTLGGYCTNKLIGLAGAKRMKGIISSSSNVVELKNKIA